MLNVKHLRTKTANAHSFDSCLPKAYNNIIVRFDLARSMVLSDRRILSKTVEISLMHVCLTEKATVIKHIDSSVNQLNDHADAQGSMCSHMLSASNNREKIKMVSKNDNQKVTTDKHNRFSSNSIPCTKQRPRKVLIKMNAE